MQNNRINKDESNEHEDIFKTISLEELRLLFKGMRHAISSPLMVLSGISYQINNIAKTISPENKSNYNNNEAAKILSKLSSKLDQAVYNTDNIINNFSKDIEANYIFPNIDSSLYSYVELYKIFNIILDKYSSEEKSKIIWSREISFEFKCNLFWFSKLIMFILDSFFDNNPKEATLSASCINGKKKIFIELKNFNKNIKIYNLEFCKKTMNIFGGTFYITQQEYITNIQLIFLH